MSTPKPVRSPSYPSTPLGQAIAQVRKIETHYRTSQVDRVAAAKLIGYSGLSGPANAALAALAHYGLVERAGKGEMRVTARATTLLHSDNASERRAELRAAAFEPTLYREIQERWPNMTPPEDGVVMYLNRKGFNQTAVRPAARAYLETLQFLQEEGASESHGREEVGPPESQSSAPQPSERDMNQPSAEHVMPDSAINSAALAAATAAIDARQLNRINMNIQGDKVHLNALLDLAGIEDLEKKLKALKVLLEVQNAGQTETAFN